MKTLLILLSLLTPKGGFAQQADSLRMDSIVHQLPDVVVKGERPIARVKGSTITYDLPRLIEKKALDNIYEAVKELPGVTETDGKLRLAGRPAHVVLDGKVTTMTVDELNALLKSLPASRIERVEVMYVAPARMQLRGAVINIILKHRTADGMPWQGEANLAWNQDHDATFGERVVVQYQRDKLGVDFLYQHSHGDTYSTTGEDSRHALDDGTVHHVETTGRRRSHGYGHSFRLGMDYDIAKDHQLSLVYNGAYDKHAAQQLIAGDVAGASDLRSHSWLHKLPCAVRVESQCRDDLLPAAAAPGTVVGDSYGGVALHGGQPAAGEPVAVLAVASPRTGGGMGHKLRHVLSDECQPQQSGLLVGQHDDRPSALFHGHPTARGKRERVCRIWQELRPEVYAGGLAGCRIHAQSRMAPVESFPNVQPHLAAGAGTRVHVVAQRRP